MKKVAKIAAIVLSALLVLVIAAALLTQTSFFRNKARTFALNKINGLLNAELSIGRLDGNLFGHIELFDVGLVRKGDTLAQISRLAVDFRVLPLLSKKIDIGSLVIDSLSASLHQNPDSSWNFSNLVKEDTLATRDSLKTGFAYKLSVDELVIQNSRVEIRTLDTASAIPDRFTGVNLRLSGELDSTRVQLDLADLRFEAFDPDLRLEHLQLVGARNRDGVSVENLILQTAGNRLEGSGSYAGDFKRGSLKLESGPLDLSEFEGFFTVPKLRVSPRLDLSADLVADTLLAHIDIAAEQNARATFDLTSYPFSLAFDSTRVGEVGYYISGDLRNIDVARWTGDTTFAYTINGKIAVGGSGVTPETMEDSLAADLSDCLVLGREVGPAGFRLTYDRGYVTGTMDIAGGFGAVNFDAIAIDILETQEYHLSFSTTDLNLSRLLNIDSLQSDLNLEIVASGVGFDPQKATGELGVVIDKSIIFNTAIDSGFVRGAFEPEKYVIDTAFITSAYGAASLAGDFGRRSLRGLDFGINIDDLRRLQPLLKTDTLGGSIVLAGKVNGYPDSIAASGQVNLSSILYNANLIDTGTIDLGVTRVGQYLAAEARIRTRDMAFGSYMVDSLSSRIEYADSVVTLTASIDKDTNHRALIEIDIDLGKVFTAVIRNIQLEFEGRRWSGGSDSTAISGGNGNFDISNFNLYGSREGDQRISLDGRLSFVGREDLELNVVSFDIGMISGFLASGYTFEGSLSGNLSLTGSAATPRLDGGLILAGGKVNNFAFDSITADVSYGGRRLEWNARLAAQAPSSITARGFLPMALSLEASKADTVEMVIGDEPMEIQVDINRFPFSVIEASGLELKNTRGWIDGEARFINTMNQPRMSGNVTLNDGGFELPEIGTKFDEIQMALSLSNDIIRLDSLFARRGNGTLLAKGEMEFDSSLISGSLSGSSFDLRSDKLMLAKSENFELQISGNARVEGSSRNPTYSGDITVDHSRIFTPMFTQQTGAELEGRPILVVATAPDTALSDTAAASEVVGQAEVQEPGRYVKNLRGTMTFKFPQDSWLRSPAMNIEISGEVQLVKNSPDLFELFGTIEVVRGDYTLYGKQFNITEGQLTFTGGPEYNPDVDINAEYVFRSPEREKQTLTLHVTGKAMEPELAFTLDGAEITQTDAVAYILFGRSMQEVTGSGLALGGGTDGGGSSEAALAKALAARLVAGQLSKTLGKGLALDIIDIKASETLRGATIAIGKYITSNLFMSYQRGVGQVTESETTPAITTLEYEFTRSFSIQLTAGDPERTGVDLLYKFEIK